MCFAYVKFKFEENSCVVFKKGFYTQESGYETASEDDETMVTVYCSYDEATLTTDQIETIIDGIQLIERR